MPETINSHPIFKEHILRILFTPSKLIAYIAVFMFTVLTFQAGAASTTVNGVCPFSCETYWRQGNYCSGNASDTCPLKSKPRELLPLGACPTGYSVAPAMSFAMDGMTSYTFDTCQRQRYTKPDVILPPMSTNCPEGTTLSGDYCVTCKAGLHAYNGQCSK